MCKTNGVTDGSRVCAPVYVFILASNATKKVSMAIICMRFESIASSLFPAAFANIFPSLVM